MRVNKKLMKRKFLLLEILTVLTGIYLVFHINIAFDPESKVYRSYPHFDKIEHFISGLILSVIFFTLISFALGGTSIIILTYIFIIVISIIFEIFESYVIPTNLSDSIIDTIFNIIGATVGLILVRSKFPTTIKMRKTWSS